MSHSWIGQLQKYITCTKALAKKKIQKQKNIMKINSNQTTIIYFDCLERQKILTICNIYFEPNKKILDQKQQTIKGIIQTETK